MAWIKMVEESEATGHIKATYEAMQRQMGFVPNVTKAFSLWPEVFDLQNRLYETVMLAKTELPNPIKEMIALVTSKANSCNYCVTHHGEFLVRYGIGRNVVRRLESDFHKAQVDEKTRQLLDYVSKVTHNAYKVTDEEVAALREVGWTDRQILEATVVAAQFNFINRIVDALGVELEPAAAAQAAPQ
ncbi:MAG: hypothetical protein COV75_07540 [Candidatus Omnitrophica bacterium CG11_big_fil_rev_8_21_14_0_20_63_9]|nr:MAG: hypothetical protein COV75_07540 [Candidatus Omnitrophica bacterium CG11_big_fil_rev_8_21_14_0_20_63_9]